eukprot:639300-Pleurochrysis_carterae.AAC.3
MLTVRVWKLSRSRGAHTNTVCKKRVQVRRSIMASGPSAASRWGGHRLALLHELRARSLQAYYFTCVEQEHWVCISDYINNASNFVCLYKQRSELLAHLRGNGVAFAQHLTSRSTTRKA